MSDGLEDWEAKLLDNENQPEFYDVLDVLSLKDNIDKVAKAVVIVYALLSVLNFRTVQGFILGAYPSTDEIPEWECFFRIFFNISWNWNKYSHCLFFPLKGTGLYFENINANGIQQQKSKLMPVH